MADVVVRSRHTIRKSPPSNRQARLIEPWTFAEAKEGTLLAGVEKAFFNALECVDVLEDHRQTAKASGKFTDEGLAADALQFAASKLAPALKRARLVLDRARADVASKRGKLTPKPADKTDAAGQMRRLWKLDKFNALPDSERNAYVAKGNLDPELVQAFLEAPEYTKLLPSDLEQVRDLVLREQHGEAAIAEITEAEEAIRIAEIALVAAGETIADDVGGAAKLDEAAKPHLAQLGVLYLRKDVGADGTEVIKVWKQPAGNLGGGIWPVATPEEIEAGQFFKSDTEWLAAGGVWPKQEKRNAA